MLTFIQAENERHRAFFKSLFESTAWILGILIAACGIAAVFLGFNTVSRAKQAATTAAETISRDAAQKESDKLNGDVQARLSKEFETPRIQALVQDAAQQATATTANKIIRQEVDRQVSSAISEEQESVHRTLKTASEAAVSQVRGTIQAEANRATQNIVDQQLTPEIKRLALYSDASLLFVTARGDDAVAFDHLVTLAKSPATPRDLATAATNTVESIIRQVPRTLTAGECKLPPGNISYDALAKMLNSDDKGKVKEFLACGTATGATFGGLVNPLGKPVPELYATLDKLFQLATTSTSLYDREASFYLFTVITGVNELEGPHLRALDNDLNTKWWHANRARFLP